jgi:hypothetical protein
MGVVVREREREREMTLRCKHPASVKEEDRV